MKRSVTFLMNPYPLLFSPVFKHRIWGGHRLREWFSECPQDGTIGEAWILSDHAEGKSVVSNGEYRGCELTTVMQAEPTWFPTGLDEFPLLFKVIDADSDLSIQVHPDDSYGYRHAGERGKTECWWVLDAKPGARVIYGHNAPTKAAFVEAVRQSDWNALLKQQPVYAGDFLFVPSGKVHALGAGTMVLEVQQSSDTTYRVYDYDRRDDQGKLRELHIQEALDVISFPDNEVLLKEKTDSLDGASNDVSLVDCPYFEVRRLSIHTPVPLVSQHVQVLVPVDGTITVSCGSDQTSSVTVACGQAVLLPRNLAVELCGETTVILTVLPN